jgi:hypothetical protein
VATLKLRRAPAAEGHGTTARQSPGGVTRTMLARWAGVVMKTERPITIRCLASAKAASRGAGQPRAASGA